jgi:hypothetical protein
MEMPLCMRAERKKHIRKKPSEAWQYFVKDECEPKVTCKMCGREYKFNGATTALRFHMRSKHGLILPTSINRPGPRNTYDPEKPQQHFVSPALTFAIEYARRVNFVREVTDLAVLLRTLRKTVRSTEKTFCHGSRGTNLRVDSETCV